MSPYISPFLERGTFSSEVAEELYRWTPVPILVDGELAACGFMLGTEIHFAVLPEYRHRVINRRIAREFFEPLLAHFPYLTTRILLGSENNDFVRRIGFQETWSDSTFTYYMMADLPPWIQRKKT
jgi:hypothetical protein